MKLVILRVAKGKCTWADAAVADYGARIDRRYRFEELRLTPQQGPRGRMADGEGILKHAPSRGRLVIVDERGERLASKAFAQLLEDAARTGAQELVFAIGGPYGHTDETIAAGWKSIRLSDLVLNHEVARVVLVEQLYRATEILRGGPYHHA